MRPQLHSYLLEALRDRPGQRSLAEFTHTMQPSLARPASGSAASAPHGKPVINLDLGGGLPGLPGAPRAAAGQQAGQPHAQFMPGSLQHLARMARQYGSAAARDRPEQQGPPDTAVMQQTYGPSTALGVVTEGGAGLRKSPEPAAAQPGDGGSVHDEDDAADGAGGVCAA